jgi:transcriptional regulator with XRE-family HTH domain
VAHAKTGMSQRQFAGAAHVAQSTIARIEFGSRQPSLSVLVKILAALNLETRITLTDYDTDDVLAWRSCAARCPHTRDDAFDPVRIISYRSSPASLASRFAA